MGIYGVARPLWYVSRTLPSPKRPFLASPAQPNHRLFSAVKDLPSPAIEQGGAPASFHP